MAFRFEDVDYDDQVAEVAERVGETVVARPHNPYGADEKWFVKETAKDEAEDDIDERVPSDLAKLKSRIDTHASDVDWKNIKKMIQALQKSLGRFLKRGRASREVVNNIVETVQTMIEEWKNQEDTKKNKVFDETKTLVDEIEAEVDKFEEESGDENEDDDDDEEVSNKGLVKSEIEAKEDPVKVLARRMTEALAAKRNARKLLREVIVGAKKLQQANIVAFALASTVRFTLDQYSHEKCLSIQGWKEALSAFMECKSVIQTNKLTVLEAQTEFTPEASAPAGTETNEKTKEVFAINYTTPKSTVVVGGLRGLYETLFEEMRRMLNNNEKQFLQCLEAECRIVDIGFDLLNDKKNTARIPSLLFSVLSQRSPALHELLCKKFNLQTPFDIDGLYQQCKSDSVTMLQYAYHLALVGKYRQAKGLLVSDPAGSRLLKQDEDWGGKRFLEIKEAVPTAVKIAYNRVIVQLSIANFKDGNVAEAAELLSSIREHANKWGILFGQGSPFNNFQLPKEMRAKTTLLFNALQTPPQYHIPQSSVELMYFVAVSMKRALETSQGLQSFERDTFANLRRNVNDVAGSASTATEFILAFDDSLQAGDVPKMVNALNNLPIWNFLDGDVSKERIVKKAKAIALQCFIYSSAANFTTITSKYLQERFEMSESEVRRTINHTILTSPEHLTAYWEDVSEQSIVVERCNVAGLRKTLGQAARNASSIQVPTL